MEDKTAEFFFIYFAIWICLDKEVEKTDLTSMTESKGRPRYCSKLLFFCVP